MYEFSVSFLMATSCKSIGFLKEYKHYRIINKFKVIWLTNNVDLSDTIWESKICMVLSVSINIFNSWVSFPDWHNPDQW